MRRLLLYVGALVIAIVLIPYIGISILYPRLGVDISGWLQAGIALVSFPIILYELDQIRQSVNQKPKLEIGVANVQDLPFSIVSTVEKLPTKVDVSQGYAHFYVVLRNKGAAPAKYVKAYIEHIRPTKSSLYSPHVKPSEFSDEKLSFVRENNFDFVFRAGTEWIINTNDIEPFGFHITTSTIVNDVNGGGVTFQRPAYPDLGEVELICTVWADGLEHPVTTKLYINIVENLERK